MSKKFIQDSLDEMDTPLSVQGKGWFKKNKLRLLIINEDGSFKEYFLKYPRSYIVDIRKMSYIVVPECILRGKYPTLVYCYNNPYPFNHVFKTSTVTALDLRSSDEVKSLKPEELMLLADLRVDSEILNLAFDNRVMKQLYALKGLTGKVLIVILIAVTVFILLILQLTGTVDVMGMLSGAQQ